MSLPLFEQPSEMECPAGYSEEQLEAIAADDDFVRLKAAEAEGRAAFAADLARRFDFDKQPRNPYPKADSRHHWWWVGLCDAQGEWF